jgi:Protein of unknown function (DUF1360)
MVEAPVKEAVAGYADKEVPLGSYAVLVAIFNGLFATLLLLTRRSRGRLPEKVGFGDVVLLGIATFRLSRMLGKDKVTSFLRAPFTEYEKPGAPGEVEERPRGRGVRRALGELLVCPYCLAQWVAAAFVYGLALAPRTTRLVASVFAVKSIADGSQIAYKAAEERKSA